jgi:vacuolar-type H+-ATPase subunit E/Vma4
MAVVISQTNRKPPDELADVREQIRELKGREDELREMLIAGEADLIGDDFVVRITKVVTERIDSGRIKKELGLEFLRPFLVTSESTVVKVEKMKGEMA